MHAPPKRLWVPITVAATMLACEAEPTAPPVADAPSFAISDAVHNDGRAHFYFLPPMVPAPAYAGAFDGTLSPIVEVCEWTGSGCGAVIAVYSTTTGPGSETVRVSSTDEQYSVNWHTDEFDLGAQLTYRIRILIESVELGFADVDVVNAGNELRNVDTNEYIPLKDGRTLPIKFRIEEGAVFVVGAEGGSFAGADGAALLTVPAGALPGTVAITVDSTASFPGDQGLIPGTVFDFQPDGTSFSPAATLTLYYDQANLPPGLPESALAIVTEEGGGWSEVENSVVDEVANTVTAQIVGFSRKGVGGSVAAVEVEPGSATLDPAETVQLVATPKDAAGNSMARNVNWSSSDEGVATVGNAGLVTAVASGIATITAQSGNTQGNAELRVVGGPVVMLVAAGNGHACAATQAGRTYCWGENGFGGLGDGTQVRRFTPTAVVSSAAHLFVDTGAGFSCGIQADGGAADCWGVNSVGQLGIGSNEHQSLPTTIVGGATFESIATGAAFACGLAAGGSVYCWGQNQLGHLGDGTFTDRSVPTLVTGGLEFGALSAGGDHACALSATGSAYCWGSNWTGELGDGTSGFGRPAPSPVSGGLAFQSLAAHYEHTCGIEATTGHVYCWGSNLRGELGDGTTVSRALPGPVAGARRFRAISAGLGFTCGIDDGDQAFCWGENSSGQLGDGTSVRRFVPTAVAGGLAFAALDAGRNFTCAITHTSDMYCWGGNTFGQLGDGTTTNRANPTRVLFPD